MDTMIFVNLPVKDLKRSMDFFAKLGFSYNQQFTDEKAACMVISKDIFAMLLKEEFFKTFIPGKKISDAHTASEVLVSLSTNSRQGVDDLMDKALAAGASIVRPPEDYGYMYGRSFQDLDGHIWEIIWMDPAHVQ